MTLHKFRSSETSCICEKPWRKIEDEFLCESASSALGTQYFGSEESGMCSGCNLDIHSSKVWFNNEINSQHGKIPKALCIMEINSVTHNSRRQLGEDIKLLARARGVTMYNKREVCVSVAARLQGTVVWCSIHAPSRRFLNELSNLFMDITVDNVFDASVTIGTRSFISTLQEIPEDVEIVSIEVQESISFADLYWDQIPEGVLGSGDISSEPPSRQKPSSYPSRIPSFQASSAPSSFEESLTLGIDTDIATVLAIVFIIWVLGLGIYQVNIGQEPQTQRKSVFRRRKAFYEDDTDDNSEDAGTSSQPKTPLVTNIFLPNEESHSDIPDLPKSEKSTSPTPRKMRHSNKEIEDLIDYVNSSTECPTRKSVKKKIAKSARRKLRGSSFSRGHGGKASFIRRSMRSRKSKKKFSSETSLDTGIDLADSERVVSFANRKSRRKNKRRKSKLRRKPKLSRSNNGNRSPLPSGVEDDSSQTLSYEEYSSSSGGPFSDKGSWIDSEISTVRLKKKLTLYE